MNKQKIDCKKVRDHICENLREELDSPTCAEIKDHLEKCENCRKFFSNVENTVSLYKCCSEELPEGAHNRLLNILGLNE